MQPTLNPAAVGTQPPMPVLPREILLEQLVRRLSWGGNGRKGSARIELGSGSLAGSTVVVHAEGSEVSIELDGPAGAEAQAFCERVSERLAARGFIVRPPS
jgi:hypothetical protein